MDYKDICVTDKQVPVHQLNKLNEKGTKREDFFPISIVQAIFDKTGIRLDAIISSFNYLFIPWKGTKEATRLQVVGLMRRKSLVICYRDLNDETTIEMYNSNERGDDEWKKNDNWVGFADFIEDAVADIIQNPSEYPGLEEEIINIVKQYLNDNLQNIVNKYLEDMDINTIVNNRVNELFNNYIKGDDFNQLVNNIISSYIDGWLDDNLQPKLDEYFSEIQQYITDNDRVTANALSRHEEDIIQLKNS